MAAIKFNPNVRLILADVDETVADVYTAAHPDMIEQLNQLLSEGKVLFLISGGGLQSIRERITNRLKPELRHRVLIAHCSGAEVWGFEKGGSLQREPYFGVYDQQLTEDQKMHWREVVAQTIFEFQLQTFPTQTKESFIQVSKGNPFAVMLADRGPQITLEFVNSVDMTEAQADFIGRKIGRKPGKLQGSYDFRMQIMKRLESLFEDAQLPITPKLGGTCALDMLLKGVDKTKAIKFVLEHENILADLDIAKADINEAQEIEIWGDKFSQTKGGPDFQMCLAVSPEVRAIDFRQEDISDLPAHFNIVLWDGQEHLHRGLLEYLKSRSAAE